MNNPLCSESSEDDLEEPSKEWEPLQMKIGSAYVSVALVADDRGR